MPYKIFRKTLHKKVRGKWTKKQTFPSTNKARKAMERLRAKERSSTKLR